MDINSVTKKSVWQVGRTGETTNTKLEALYLEYKALRNELQIKALLLTHYITPTAYDNIISMTKELWRLQEEIVIERKTKEATP